MKMSRSIKNSVKVQEAKNNPFKGYFDHLDEQIKVLEDLVSDLKQRKSHIRGEIEKKISFERYETWEKNEIRFTIITQRDNKS
jgi:hypothetical protein